MNFFSTWSKIIGWLPKLEMYKQLDCVTFGVSNNLRNDDGFVFFFETDGGNPNTVARTISSIINADIVVFSTKHGWHYISFLLMTESEYFSVYETIYRHYSGNYYNDTKRRDFILRVSPKFKINANGTVDRISEQPYYYTYINGGRNGRLSVGHLKLYYKVCGIPKSLCSYLLSKNAIVNKPLRFTFYKTRD